MNGRVGERIEVISPETTRLELAEEAVAPVRPSSPIGTVTLTLAGAAVLAAGLSILWTAGFAQDQFARAAWLGWATVGVAVGGFGLLGAAVAREVRGLLRLDRVDRLRADLASGDGRRIATAARSWVSSTGQTAILPAIDRINDPDAILALLEAGPVREARRDADALGRVAARQMVAALAALPAPGLAVGLVAWRGLRLIRDVAAVYGVRPGLFGTVALLRRTVMSASLVGAAEIATNAAAHAILSNPLLAHALGDVAGAGVAARRMLVLARATATACDPTAPKVGTA